MVEFLLKPWQKREEVLHGDGRVVTTVAIRCSFHVFVAYRVYSPIRFAVSMGTRGKTYRFSLSTPLKENSFEYPLATFRFSHLLRISFVSSFRREPQLYLPRQGQLLLSGVGLRKRKGTEESERRGEEDRRGHGNAVKRGLFR